MNKLTEKGFRNTTVIRGNAKDLPSKIKKDGYENDYKNIILIQKYQYKKDILFLSNYYIFTLKLQLLTQKLFVIKDMEKKQYYWI